MKFDNFSIRAEPYITDGVCTQCYSELIQVTSGWFSAAMFCPKCESVYSLKLIRVNQDKVSTEFLTQAREEAKRKRRIK